MNKNERQKQIHVGDSHDSNKVNKSGHVQQQNNQSPLQNIKRAWNNFEIKLIKAVTGASSTSESRQEEVTNMNVELIKARAELRNLLNEAEATVKDNAKEFKALNLMAKSGGYCVGRGRKRRRS